MYKKIFFIIAFIICFFTSASAHNSLNGWYSVKIINKTDSCDLDNVWAYYKDGIEIERRCYLLLAHRGWGDAPENSLESFKLVKENGYNGFETDIRFTKDNIAILSHDETINRIGRNKDLSKIKDKLYVKDLTYDEINNYVFPTNRNNKVLEDYYNNKITTLEEALIYAKNNKLYIAIELKEGNIDQIKSVIKLVYKYKMEGSVRYLSFFPKLLKRVRDIDSSATLQLLDRSIHVSKGRCTPDYETKYCRSITKRGLDEGYEQRVYFHKLLDTNNNFVYINGENIEEYGKSTSLISNYPESIIDYPPLSGKELILADEVNQYELIISKMGLELKNIYKND